ncbi:MAG TPA: TerC family protein [Bryobacteraceae bacterium]|jgi:tellurite resistance protein TerC
MTAPLFPFAGYWGLYVAFAALVLVLLALDLGVFHRKAQAPSFGKATLWMSVWVALALVFCFVLYQYTDARFGDVRAKRAALEFLTGYVVEESLSLDNMFVFVLVFAYFRIPERFHHRVLFYGILGALVFRGVFIALGSALLQFGWVVLLFGVFLIFTGLRMILGRERQVQPERNWVMRLLRRVMPVTADLAGQRLVTRIDGKLHATPLLLALATIETADIIFAVDSVPAIFAITKEPFIVYTSNIFAILGLRSMYFLLSGAIGRFHLLRYGLAVVLIFVGVKMSWLNPIWGGHFPITISLAVIGGVLAASIGLSLVLPRPRQAWAE